MGDVPISYIEGVGGTRVSEDDAVAVGKNDVSTPFHLKYGVQVINRHYRSCHSRLVGKPASVCTVLI